MILTTRSLPSATARPLRRGAPALGLVLLLGACSASPSALLSSAADGGGAVASESLTTQRVRGTPPEVAPLLPEPGNVWPEQEAPRPTLLSGPDEAMRNIPEYRPSLIEGSPAARSPVPTPAPGARRPGSGASLETLPPPGRPPRFEVLPPVATPAPGRPAEGQVMVDPSGRPAVVTGEAGRIRGVTQPGMGGGAVLRDGNVETWIGPDGRTQTRIVPQ